MMHEREKSDPQIVPEKPENKADRSVVESGEGGGGAIRKASPQIAVGAQSRDAVSQAQARTGEAATSARSPWHPTKTRLIEFGEHTAGRHPSTAWRRQARHLRLSRLHPYLRADQGRQGLPTLAQERAQTDEGRGQSDQG